MGKTMDDEIRVDNNDPMKRLCDDRYHSLRNSVQNIEDSSKRIEDCVNRLSTMVESHDEEIRGGHGPGADSGIRGKLHDLKAAICDLQKRGVNWPALVTTVIVSVTGIVVGGIILAWVLGRGGVS